MADVFMIACVRLMLALSIVFAPTAIARAHGPDPGFPTARVNNGDVASPVAPPAPAADASEPLPPVARGEPDAPATKPPVFNRANDHLPSWLRVRGELRERMEGFRGGGFDQAREDHYWLTRVRLDATVAPAEHVKAHLQVQDARVSRKTVGPTGPPFRAPFDLRMAYADVGSSKGPVTARVGRQELAYGEQRLVGHVSWVNAARTFDGAKVTLRAKAFDLDAFATSVVRILEDEFDKSGNGNRFLGVYLKTGRLLPGGSVEPYVFRRRDVNLPAELGPRGTLGQTTLGVRLNGPLSAGVDYDVDLALQRGSLGSDEVRAWAGHWRVRKGLSGPFAVLIIGLYNHASGDRDPTDGIRGTFDQLYPTAHDKYGLADQVGWRNIHHSRAAVDVLPIRKLTVTAGYHSWWVAEPRDALYNAAGAPIARVVEGASSRHVGQELDVQVGRPLTPQLQLLAGYAHIFPGGFLKQATPGASYSHPFVMLTYVFLAEK